MIFTDCRSCLEFECAVWVVGADMRNSVKLWKISQIHIDVNEREKKTTTTNHHPHPHLMMILPAVQSFYHDMREETITVMVNSDVISVTDRGPQVF